MHNRAPKMLWVDKYHRKTLDQVIIHEDVAQLSRNRYRNKIVPICSFNSPLGSGKKNLIMALLRQLSASSSEKWKVEFPGDAIPNDSSSLFRVHPPYSVHRKVYELSLHIPMEVRMKPIPLTHILTDILRNEGRDIGLYFYPADTVDRYIEKYSALVQLLVSQEHAMRGLVNGAELLILTSKELHVDSHCEFSGFLSFVLDPFTNMLHGILVGIVLYFFFSCILLGCSTTDSDARTVSPLTYLRMSNF